MKSGEAKLFTVILIIAIALVAVVAVPTMLNPPPPVGGLTPVEVRHELSRDSLVPPGSLIAGDPKAPYTLIEFGDFQCPRCGKLDPRIGMVAGKYKDKMSYVFHPIQITPTHRFSPQLTTAAMAARQQGKYWPMHHALYEHQVDLVSVNANPDALMKLAGDLKLDQLRFRSSLNDPAVQQMVTHEQQVADSLKVGTTPSFYFVNSHGTVTSLPTEEQMEKFLADPKNWK